jgi:hypothetical protein
MNKSTLCKINYILKDRLEQVLLSKPFVPGYGYLCCGFLACRRRYQRQFTESPNWISRRRRAADHPCLERKMFDQHLYEGQRVHSPGVATRLPSQVRTQEPPSGAVS